MVGATLCITKQMLDEPSTMGFFGSTKVREMIWFDLKKIAFMNGQLSASGNQCSDVEYLQMSGMQYARPSVSFIFSFTGGKLKHFQKQKDFLTILQCQLQASWLTYIEMVGLNHTMNPLFRDLTKKLGIFGIYYLATVATSTFRQWYITVSLQFGTSAEHQQIWTLVVQLHFNTCSIS